MRFATIADLPEAHQGEAMRQMKAQKDQAKTEARRQLDAPKLEPERKTSEHDEQVALFQWARMNEGRWPALRWMFAIPNGGQRATVTAIRLKAEGVKAGVPDIFLPCPQENWAGLWIELKAGSNKPTDTQREWLAGLREQGYVTAVCWGAGEAIRVIENYLRGEQMR